MNNKNINNHSEYWIKRWASKGIWITKTGKKIRYKNLEKGHLNNILNLMNKGKLLLRKKYCYNDLIQEKLRRTSELGKILYE